MKQKTAVLQGMLALMVLKTPDLLEPLHSYGIARRRFFDVKTEDLS
jgi:PadR family transcriptional regulator PadR